MRRLRVAFCFACLGWSIGWLLACKDEAPEPCVPSETVTVDTVHHVWTMEGTMCREPQDGTTVHHE